MPGKGESLSSLNGRARPPLATSVARREPSSTPSSRSNRHSRTWRAISTRIRRFARRATIERMEPNSASSCDLSDVSSSRLASDAAFTTRSCAVVYDVIVAGAGAGGADVARGRAFAVLIALPFLVAERCRCASWITALGKVSHHCHGSEVAWRRLSVGVTRCFGRTAAAAFAHVVAAAANRS